MSGKIQSLDESIVNWVGAELEARGATNDMIYQLITIGNYTEELPLAKSQHDQLTNCYIFWVKVLSIIEESSDLTFKENVPIAMENIFFEISNVDTFIRKIRNRVKLAIKRQDNNLLMEDVFTNVPNVGKQLMALGITEEWLENPVPIEISSIFSKEAVLELNFYKKKKKCTYEQLGIWIKHILKLDSCPNLHTLRSQIQNMLKKKQNLIRGNKNVQEILLKSPYDPPKPCECQQKNSQSSTVVTDINHTSVLYEALKSKSKEINKLWSEKEKVEKRCQLIKTEKRHVVGKLFDANKKAEKLMLDKQRCMNKINILSVRNTNKKLKRRDKKILKLKSENDILHSKLQSLNKSVKSVKDKYSNLKALSYYYKGKTNTQKEKIAQSVNENENLKKSIEILEDQNANLSLEFSKISSKIETYQKGKYTDEIRLVCYELLNKGVSTKNIPEVIKFVLKSLASLEVDRLPKPTLLKYMSTEAGFISKSVAAKQLLHSESNTIQTDGTTKKHNKYLNFVATTSTGKLLGLGLQDHFSGDAQSQLDGMNIFLDELANYIQCSSIESLDKEKSLHQMLISFKNSMTDRHIVNNKFVKILEEWREQILPLHVENWENLDDKKKTEIISINDFYCGMHFILGLQDNFESNIKEWEKVESGGDKLGRENLFNWHRMGSATLQFIRSVCEGFGKEACEKSGKPKELAAFIKKPVFLTSFKHNRFNIPFINSTFCIFHLQDILNFLKTLSKDKNKLMKSIEADGNDIIIVAATTAMSILEMHITTPLMKLMNKNDVNVVEISNYYTCLQDKLKIWSIDPLELLNGSAVLFEDIPPNKNEIYKYVYESFCDNDLIRQALAVGCKSFLIVTERMLADHLPGGKFNDPSIQIQNETKSVPKHNIACERFFSGLDRLVRKMPTANTIGIEGILLWSLNETSDYLDNIDKKERELIISAARKQTPDILKKYRARKALIKSKTEEKVIENANLVARKEQNLQINKNKLIQFVNTNGGPVNCKSSIMKLFKKIEKKSQTLKFLTVKNFIKYEKLFLFQKKICKLYSFQTGKRKYTFQELQQNLCKIVESRNNDNVSHNMEIDFNSDQIISNVEPQINESGPTDSVPFQLIQNMYVAVAYNEGFFVGIVTEIIDNHSAFVKFMKWKKQQLVWPQPETVENVQSKYIFCTGLDLCTLTGRLYFLSGDVTFSHLKEKYDNYASKYFNFI